MYPDHHQQNQVPISYYNHFYSANPFCFPQTSDSIIHSPVTNPLAYSTTPFAIAAQTTNSQNWILRHANPNRYDYAMVPLQDTAPSTLSRTLNMQALVPLQETSSTTFPGTMKDGWSHPYVTNEDVYENQSNICNVKCTSQDVYKNHIAGRKHFSKVARMSNNGVGPSNNPPKKIKLDKSVACEVCKCECNSREMYNTHIAGKKHLKNMKKLSKLKTDASADTTTANTSQQPANPIIEPQEKPDTEKPESLKAPEMEIVTKKLKLVEGGAAEADDVRYCSLCDVACNSQKQFNTHLAGHKHVSRVKKQRAESNRN